MHRWLSLALGAALLAACQGAPAAPSGRNAAVPSAAGPAAAAATAPAGAAASPGPLYTVRVGGVGSASEATFYWAQEHGYFREEGLDFEMQTFNGAQVMIAPLGADQLDVGSGGPGPGLFNAILRGVDLKIVADRSRAAPGTSNQCLMIRKSLLDSGQVHSFADWKGKTFAENVPGVLTTSLIDRELQKVGLNLQTDVTSVTLGFPEMFTAFANEAIDFGILIEPFYTLSEEQGTAKCWKPTSEIGPNFQIAVTLYGPTFAEQHADEARRFMVANLRAMRDYNRAFFGDGEGRDEFWDLMTRTSNMKDLALLKRLHPTWSDPNGAVNVDTLRDVQRWYIGRGEQTGEVDFDRVIDMSFVDYALQRLGRYPET
ncbi:MAG TPA: ABC transporter substrate-binding protein [Chloroflexota bacterium]|nr:ABC transporter substrate-binding protein [Chloroflexota bacterium]